MKFSKVLSSLLLATVVMILSTGSASAQDPIQLYLDIKPGSCVNPLNVRSHGTLTMALLGTEEFSVEDVDAGSIMLSPDLGPVRTFLEDVGAPPDADGFACGDCPVLEPDGFIDLVLKFRTDDVVELLEIWPATYVELEVTGMLLDGTEFVAIDCVLPLQVVSGDLLSDVRNAEEKGRTRQRGRGRGH